MSAGALIAAIFLLAGAHDNQVNGAYARAHAHARAMVLDIVETRDGHASRAEARIRYTPLAEDRDCVTTVTLNAARLVSRGDILDIVPRDWPCVDPILLPAPSPLPGYAAAAMLGFGGIVMMGTAFRLRRAVIAHPVN